MQALRQHLPELLGQSADIQAVVGQKISHIVLSNKDILIQLTAEAGQRPAQIRVPRPTLTSKETRVQLRKTPGAEAHPNQQLLRALVRAHSWVKLLMEGQHQSVESRGAFVGLHPKIIRNGIRLAFLDPTITNAIVQGQQASTLRDFAGAIPLSWADQRTQTG